MCVSTTLSSALLLEDQRANQHRQHEGREFLVGHHVPKSMMIAHASLNQP